MTYLQKKNKKLWTMPAHLQQKKTATNFGMRLFNDTYQLLFPLKLQNFKCDCRNFTHSWILRKNNNVYPNLTEWLTRSGGTKFSKPIEETSREELNVCWMCFYTSSRKRYDTYYITSLMKSIEELRSIVSFSRRRTTNLYKIQNF